MPTQSLNLSRVNIKVAHLVTAFIRGRGVGSHFHMEDLTKYVTDQETVAPDSPGRILRDLRSKGKLDYKVISRSQSLYQIT